MVQDSGLATPSNRGWGMANEVAGAGRPERQPIVMQFYSARGSPAAAEAADSAAAVMDAAIWGAFPEELMWEVLRLVPAAAKLVQWQLVSRKWRQELASARFWRTRRVQAAAQGGAVAWVWPCSSPCDAHGRDCGISRDDAQQHCKVFWAVDLWPVVPPTFWEWPHCPRYSVEAAAHGLVCISNNSMAPDKRRYCVLNPLTRACVVLPRLPFPARRWYLPTTGTTGGSGGDSDGYCAITILGGYSEAGWVLATYRVHQAPAAAVAAAGGAGGPGGGGDGGAWVVVPAGGRGHLQWAPSYVYWRRLLMHALLGGESYWYNRHDDRVQALAAGGEAREEVEVGALDGPSVAQMGLDASLWTRADKDWTPVLAAAHPPISWSGPPAAGGGAIFLVSQLTKRLPQQGPAYACMACGVWRLVRERMEWEAVALLGAAELEGVMGVTHSRSPPDGHLRICLYDAYVVGRLLCCHVRATAMRTTGSGGTVTPGVWELVSYLLAFNLGTGKWELLLHGKALEPRTNRPDIVFLDMIPRALV